MHTDEAVNAYIVGQSLAGKPYTYDPQDRHGPVLTAFALPLARLQGAKTFSDLTESELRLTSVLAGTVTVLLFLPAVELFGFIPCFLAALLFACAPLPVYYDRYFIHESLFVAASFALILAVWRAFTEHSVPFAALAGFAAALVLASKETAVLHFLALTAAVFAFWLWNLRRAPVAGLWRPRIILTISAVFLVAAVLLFTWFGANWQALPALLRAVPDYLARAGGQGHQKPFWYYARLLTGGWSGGLIVALAVIGFLRTLLRRDPSLFGFLACYGLFLAAIYSFIPYKTPWLALNFWLPIALLAALGMRTLWRLAALSLSHRTLIPASCILGAFAALLIAHDTRQRVFLQPADETNPYAYAQTSEDLLGLPVELQEIAAQRRLASPRIAVIAADPWPLPWYLRHYSQVGFWQPGQPVPPADFYITSTEAADQYHAQLQDLRPDFFGLRPGVLVLLWSPEPK